jgi:hypothetical protein
VERHPALCRSVRGPARRVRIALDIHCGRH